MQAHNPGESTMTYRKYTVAVATDQGLDFLEVVACDVSAALADVREAFYADTLDIVSVTLGE